MKGLVDRLARRDLFKRALVISRRTVDQGCDAQLWRYLKKDPDALRELAKMICDTAGLDDPEEVWVDVPSPPVFDEAAQSPVRTGEGRPPRLREIFPVDEWTKAFALNKYRSHVFCPPERRRVVYEAARDVMREQFDLRFTDEAWTQCKAGLE